MTKSDDFAVFLCLLLDVACTYGKSKLGLVKLKNHIQFELSHLQLNSLIQSICGNFNFP